MNTPKPCVDCIHLYWDVMFEESVDCPIECKEGEVIGNVDCPKYSPVEGDKP